MKKIILLQVMGILSLTVMAQPERWQQRIAYQIKVNMDVKTNRFNGSEKIDYWNNSPDTLTRIFFHTYWNAFQPGSMMDVRSRELGKIEIYTNKKGEPVYDWDSRVKDRILNLKPDEVGFQKVSSVKINGIDQILEMHETILEVKLHKPILPQSKISLELDFEAQVPFQVRRSGRDNAEGIRYSMSQWYPKMVEYDYKGWNANPYVAREFYGVWGDYDVNITIDKSYMLAGTGTIQNANETGFGYQDGALQAKPTSGNTLTWKFAAKNVHDFVWAADPDYSMIKKQITNGPLLYIVYKNVDSVEAAWQLLADKMAEAYPFIAKTFGAYPYKNYSFIQGGDGGMEYPMATLIKNASLGIAIHEWMHAWYQGMLATNESLYPWMDEGFTTFAESRVTAFLNKDSGFAFSDDYAGYFRLAKSGKEEPLSTHADHYTTNYAYGNAVYSKGSVYLAQLGYIVGDKVLDRILLEYFKDWKFKHPNANDFIREAEKVSGMELQWYNEYWVNSTKTIDYAIGDINRDDGTTKLTLQRHGFIPMPVDLLITYRDGTKELHYIPMNLMYGEKTPENDETRIIHAPWPWVNTSYTLELTRIIADIKSIEIDPSLRMADLNRINNKIKVP